MFWLKIFAGVILVATIALQSKWIYVISPPLIVTFIEFAKSSGKSEHRPGHLFWLVFVAAFSGSLGVEVIHILLHWPLWIAAACIVIWIFFPIPSISICFSTSRSNIIVANDYSPANASTLSIAGICRNHYFYH